MIPATKIPVDKTKDFFFAGKATLTLKNTKSGNRFTYKITTPKKQDLKNPVYFVNVMNGSDNETDYAFVGTIFGKNTYKHSTKSELAETETSVSVIKAFINFLSVDKVPNGLEVWHEGKCGKCGKKLTVPESLYTGFGKKCSIQIEKQQLQLEAVNNVKGLSQNVIAIFKEQATI